jgi:protein-disulfide isomerase/uncharacterized membrane protein
MNAFALLPSPVLATTGDPGTIIGAIVVGWLLCAGLAAWKRYAGMAGAGLFGVGVSLYLGFQHAADAGQSICSVSETLNCDTVNRSEYSELFGIPIAFLGTGFYTAVVVVAVLALMKPDSHKRAANLVFLGSALSVGYSLFLAWVSSQMGAWCLFCISLYGVNLLLFGSSFLAARQGEGSLLEGITAGLTAKGGDKSISPMLTAGALALAASVFAYNRTVGGDPGPSVADRSPDQIDPAELAALFEAPAAPLELDGTEPILGDPSAPYVIVEFADYQCPHCAATAPTIKQLVAAHPEIQVRFKHYPLSNLCNDAMGSPFHEYSCGAAMAADCAGQQGRFWELSDLMFKNQQYLTPDDLKFMAGQVGLDMAAWEQCLTDPATDQGVRLDAAAGNQAGLTGTPTLYLRGVKGDEFVQVKGLAEEAAALVAAHKMGLELPPTPKHSAPR